MLQPRTPRSNMTLCEAEQFDQLRLLTVLLVEDNEINQLVAGEVLRDAGMIVDLANNGEEAVQHAQSKRYDAILMDLQMPVMDGIEATRRIREIAHAKRTPIIAMTADEMEGARELVLEAGMDAYVTKPFDRMQLFRLLHDMIQRQTCER